VLETVHRNFSETPTLGCALSSNKRQKPRRWAKVFKCRKSSSISIYADGMIVRWRSFSYYRMIAKVTGHFATFKFLNEATLGTIEALKLRWITWRNYGIV